MRFCNFCDKEFNEIDSHWISNGSLKGRCRFQRIDYNKRIKKIKKEYNALYYEQNHDSILLKSRESYKLRKSAIAEQRKQRRLLDPLLKVKDSYGAAAKRALRQKGYKAKTKSSLILDCSYDFLVSHIESQFSECMNWVNYGIIWEIDHICPLHQAITYDEIVKLCSHRNLRPFPVTLNRRKQKTKTLEAEAMCKLLLNRDWK